MGRGSLKRFRAGDPKREVARVRKLKTVDEEWQASIRPAYVWIDEPSHSYRPVAIYVVNERGAIRASAFLEERPTQVEALSALLKSMYAPSLMSGGKCRPRRIVIDDEQWVTALAPGLGEVDVECRFRQRVPAVDRAQVWLCERMTGRAPVPGMLDVEGMTLPMVERLYQQAARFYRRAPWRWLNDQHPIAISCPPEAEPRYTIVMGSAREVFGLAFYDNLADLREMFLMSSQQAVRKRTWSVLFFEEARAVGFADLDSIERYGFEIAGRDAYPVFGRTTLEAEVRESRPDDLRFADAALAALLAQIDGYESGELDRLWPVDRIVEVSGLSGPQQVRLQGRPGMILGRG